jgi:NADH-quinone oxidoreductase subunit M
MGSQVLSFGFTFLATLGVILAAVYMLYMFQKVYMGDVTHKENENLPQLHWTEKAVLVPILIAILWIGIQPAPFFATMDATVEDMVAEVQPHIDARDAAVTYQPDSNALVLNEAN